MSKEGRARGEEARTPTDNLNGMQPVIGAALVRVDTTSVVVEVAPDVEGHINGAWRGGLVGESGGRE